MKLLNGAAIVLATLSCQAQFAGGSGMMGGGLSGVGSRSFGGAVIARVNVAPNGGGFQGAGTGFQGGGAGGLFGVTRPSLMAVPNTQAAQFLRSGGINVPVRATAEFGNAAGTGMYLGAQSSPRTPGTGLLAATPAAAAAETPEALPEVPFAPPPPTPVIAAVPKNAFAGGSSTRPAQAVTTSPAARPAQRDAVVPAAPIQATSGSAQLDGPSNGWRGPARRAR